MNPSRRALLLGFLAAPVAVRFAPPPPRLTSSQWLAAVKGDLVAQGWTVKSSQMVISNLVTPRFTTGDVKVTDGA